MKSTKSASVYKPRPKRDLILRRKRDKKPRARLFQWDRDKQWLWAAYRHGKAGFAEEAFEPDLTMDQFYNTALPLLENISFPFLMESFVKDQGVVPVGLASLYTVGQHVEPHLYWFWWSSPRNRYEGAFKLFHKLAEDVPFVIAVKREFDKEGKPLNDPLRLAEHITRAGILRRIGTSYNWSSEPMALYETRI